MSAAPASDGRTPPARPLAVLQVITSTDRRGAQILALELGRTLEEGGVRVRTVALAPGSSPGAALDVPTLGRKRLGPPTLRALRAAARDVDVVVAHGSTTLPASVLGLVGSGTPFVYRNIGDPAFWSDSRSKRLRTRWLLGRAARIVALTTGTAQVLVDSFGVPSGRVEVIPNGRASDRFRPARPAEREAARRTLGLGGDAPVVVFLGSLSEEKNPSAAVAAVEGVPGARLVVAGEGPLRAEVEARARELLREEVVFTGMTDDPLALYHAADVIVLPSWSEGLPGVLIEAGLCGVPAVASDVGFVRDIVVDGVTGFVVPPDEPARFSKALLAAIDDRGTLGAAARAHTMEHFSLVRVSEKWHRVLEDAASG